MTTFETCRSAFSAIVPDLIKMASVQFRDLDPDARDEAVANTLALTWHGYVSIIRQGRGDEPGIVRSILWYSVKQTRAGRSVPTGIPAKPKDVFVYARRGRIKLESVELREYVSDETPVPDAVAFRLDFPAFLATLSDRQREVAVDLLSGMGTGECAAKHLVTPAAISQTRARIADQYAEFVAG